MGIDTKCIYETGLPDVVRFMVDAGLFGVNWVKIPSGKYSHRNRQQRVSTCQLELDVSVQDIVSYAPVDDWATVHPMRVLSFDIECAGRKNIFPEPDKDPVIQIACITSVQGSDAILSRDIFCLGSCSHIAGANIHSFQREEDMLASWAKHVGVVDPDVIIGYNSSNFDFPYLIDRAKALGIGHLLKLGRFTESIATAKNSLFSSKAHGTRETKVIST